jgi:hypothetical protein
MQQDNMEELMPREAEEAVISSLLINPDGYPLITGRLNDHDFSDQDLALAHQGFGKAESTRGPGLLSATLTAAAYAGRYSQISDGKAVLARVDGRQPS